MRLRAWRIGRRASGKRQLVNEREKKFGRAIWVDSAPKSVGEAGFLLELEAHGELHLTLT